MGKTIFILLAVLGCFASCAQTKKAVDAASKADSAATPLLNRFEYLQTIPGRFSTVEPDILGNIFLITESGQLKKLNAKGDSVAVFNDVKKYGNPSQIDVGNPLKVLLYYRDYATIVVLDRMLAQRNIISLRRQNLLGVQAVATSYDNNIWVFDEQDLKLKKIDELGKVMAESNDFRQFLTDLPNPVQIIDRDNLVYLYDAQKGFFLFDYYGTFRNSLPFTGWQSVNVWNNILYGFTSGGTVLNSYQINSLNHQQFSLPQNLGRYKSIKVGNGKVYLLKEEGVDIYRIVPKG